MPYRLFLDFKRSQRQDQLNRFLQANNGEGVGSDRSMNLFECFATEADPIMRSIPSKQSFSYDFVNIFKISTKP